MLMVSHSALRIVQGQVDATRLAGRLSGRHVWADQVRCEHFNVGMLSVSRGHTQEWSVGTSAPRVIMFPSARLRVPAGGGELDGIPKSLVSFAVRTGEATERSLAIIGEEVDACLGAAMHSQEALCALASLVLLRILQAICQGIVGGIAPEYVAQFVPGGMCQRPHARDG